MSDEYSLWLTPSEEEPAHQRLSEIIRTFAHSYDDAPVFDPHITIVGGLSGAQERLTEQAQSLAQDCDSFTVSFTHAQCSTTRHQCVFLLVEPTLELLSLHQAASRLFATDEDMYVPHLSLIYSDMSIEQRLAMVESLADISFPTRTHIEQLKLVKTTGSVPEWETVATFTL